MKSGYTEPCEIFKSSISILFSSVYSDSLSDKNSCVCGTAADMTTRTYNLIKFHYLYMALYFYSDLLIVKILCII